VSHKTARARFGEAAVVLAMNLRLRRGEVIGVALFATFGVLLFCGWLFFGGPNLWLNWGFGPEWDCSDQGRRSTLVCIKHPLKAERPN
jgi:hypothetical protein